MLPMAIGGSGHNSGSMLVRTFAGLTVMVAILGLESLAPVLAQERSAPALRAGSGVDTVRIDGILSELAWSVADMADTFAQTDPSEGAPPTFRTAVQVLAGRNTLIIGIVCDDADPHGIVSFSVRRDAGLQSEDHVRVVLGPFRDGRSGYVFAVNPSGARYDGVINPGGENDNSEWNPTALLTVEFNGERNIGRVRRDRFAQNLVGTRWRINFSPNLSIASYAQYDTDSESVGINSRLHWTFLPVADLFIVYNHNVRSLLNRWELDSNQLLIKLQYAWRM